MRTGSGLFPLTNSGEQPARQFWRAGNCAPDFALPETGNLTYSAAPWQEFWLGRPEWGGAASRLNV
jgi:hypothetical protein